VLSAEIMREAQPCIAKGGLGLASVGGALIMTEADEGSLAVHVIEGGAISTMTLYQAAAAQSLRGASSVVAFEGRAAFAFSVFDRSREQGEIWIAIARTARPSSTGDWDLHALFTSDRLPLEPALMADGARFMLTFGTITGVGRETEQRSQHLAVSFDLGPRSEADWRVMVVDAARGGPGSIERHGTNLAIAYGHSDASAAVHSIVMATSIEATPIGPESFAVNELDQTVLPAHPRMLDFGATLGILYRLSAEMPLVFRSAPRF
jgi:hypothetical protein